MVASYNQRAENQVCQSPLTPTPWNPNSSIHADPTSPQGLTPDEMHAYTGNLLDPVDPSPASLSSADFQSFDLAAVGLGFHHFGDPDFAARQLAARLRPGGVLFIVDFLPHGHHDVHAHAGVAHHGFSEERVREIFEGAGVGKGFGLEEMGEGVVFHNAGGEGKDMRRRVFIARGEKA